MDIRFLPPELRRLDEANVELCACTLWSDERPLHGFAGLARLAARRAPQRAHQGGLRDRRGGRGPAACPESRTYRSRRSSSSASARAAASARVFRKAVSTSLAPSRECACVAPSSNSRRRGTNVIEPEHAITLTLECVGASPEHDAWWLVEGATRRSGRAARGRRAPPRADGLSHVRSRPEPAGSPPKDAATLIVVREAPAGGVEVFCVERQKVRFPRRGGRLSWRQARPRGRDTRVGRRTNAPRAPWIDELARPRDRRLPRGARRSRDPAAHRRPPPHAELLEWRARVARGETRLLALLASNGAFARSRPPGAFRALGHPGGRVAPLRHALLPLRRWRRAHRRPRRPRDHGELLGTPGPCSPASSPASCCSRPPRTARSRSSPVRPRCAAIAIAAIGVPRSRVPSPRFAGRRTSPSCFPAIPSTT